MKVTEIKEEELRKRVSVLKEGYLLTEVELLEDGYYDEQAKKLTNDLPVSKSVSDIIDEVDPFTIDTDIWADTQFDDFKENGPILCHFGQDSKIIDQYLSLWGGWNVGVFIVAISEESLVGHLRSILMVNMPGKGEVHYRLQETRKLAAILNSMDSPERLSDLLGPIKWLYWQQNCGAVKTFYCVENINPKIDTHPDLCFSFSEKEKQKINTAELVWFKKSILNDILFNIEIGSYKALHLKNISNLELEDLLEQNYTTALSYKISSEKGLRFFLNTAMYYPEFIECQDTLKIATDQNWSETKKTTALKIMLGEYMEEVRVNTITR